VVLNTSGGNCGGIATPAVTLTAKFFRTCANSEILVTKSGGQWALTGGGQLVRDITALGSSYTNASAPAIIAYDNVGLKDLTVSAPATNAGSFINITDTRPLPTIDTPIPVDQEICTDKDFVVTLTGTSNNPNQTIAHEWEVARIANPSATTIQQVIFTSDFEDPGDVTLPFNGTEVTYQFKYRTFDQCCRWSVPVYKRITLKPKPETPELQPVPPPCYTSEPVVYTVKNPTIPVSSYVWTITNGTIVGPSTGPSISVNWDNTQPFGTIQIQSVAPPCSSNTVTYTISIKPEITSFSTLPSPATVCAGESVIVTANSPTATGYTFSLGGTVVQSGPSSIYTLVTSNTGTTPTTQTLSVVPTLNGCDGPAQTTTITVNPAPVIDNITASPSLCAPFSGSVTFTAIPVAPNPSIRYTFLRLPIGGQPVQTLASNSTANSITVNSGTLTPPLQDGDQILVSANYNGLPCQSPTAQLVVIINNPPVISAVANPGTPICLGQSANLIANAITSTGGLTYIWQPGTLTGDQVTVTPASTGPNTFTVTATDPNGCTGTATVTVSVNPLNAIAVTAGQNTLCAGQSTTLTATGAQTYTWAPASGLSSTTGSSVTANPTSTTTYTVTGTDANGCTATQATITLTVNTPAALSATAAQPTLCVGQSTTLTATGGQTYTWAPATGLSSTTGNTVTANPATTTTYTVTGTDANGCTATQATVTISVNPLNQIVVSGITTICLGQSTTLTATGAQTYTWVPATGLSSTTGNTVTANPTSSTTYTVTGTDANGCTATQATVIVSVNPLNAIAVTAGQNTLCAGQSTTLTATGAQTYTWAPATGLSSTTGSSVTANPSSTTT
jgi:hypothetical protein